jgi:hypothetical protein
MTAQFLGKCACGAIRYACDVAPAAVFHCHCRDCQRSSGAPMSTIAVVPRTGFSLLSGYPRSYAVTSNSGNTMRREFFGDCGSPLFLDLGAARPDIWIIRATSFDNPGAFEPSMHVLDRQRAAVGSRERRADVPSRQSAELSISSRGARNV